MNNGQQSFCGKGERGLRERIYYWKSLLWCGVYLCWFVEYVTFRKYFPLYWTYFPLIRKNNKKKKRNFLHKMFSAETTEVQSINLFPVLLLCWATAQIKK